jgi:signal transduction histidine kinase
MKQVDRFDFKKAAKRLNWRRYGIDCLLAIGGVTLVTALIVATHLYPRIPTISLSYLLVILALASWRGLFAAILASVLSVISYLYFLVPPLYTFIIPRAEDLFTLVIFLATAIITSQLASALRKRAEEAYNRERELRLLYAQAQELATLQERQRLARELHDSVSQALYGISLGAHTAQEAVENDPEQVLTSLHYILDLAEAGLAEMRALIFELRPESLEMEGLVAALNKQVAVLRTRYKLIVDTEMHFELDVPLELKQSLYRIAQEALHNIVKHARASKAILRLTKEANDILLEIQDNGKGFDPKEPFPGHLGLLSMHERAAKVNGILTIESAPGQGTCVSVRVPFII